MLYLLYFFFFPNLVLSSTLNCWFHGPSSHHLSSFKCGFLNIFSRQNLLHSLSRILFLLQIWREKMSEKPHSFDFRDDSTLANQGAGKTIEKPLKDLPWNQTRRKARTALYSIDKHQYLENCSSCLVVALNTIKMSLRKVANWGSVAGLALTNNDTKRLVSDPKLASIKLISNIKQLWRSPHKTLDVARLEIHGKPDVFRPFIISLGRFLVIDPTSSVVYLTEVSEDWGSMRILRDIKPPCVQLPVSCYPYLQDTLIMTDINKDSPTVFFVTIDEDVHSEFTFKNNNVSFKYPFNICESNESFFVSDNERHCLFKLDIQSGTMDLARMMARGQLLRCHTPVESQVEVLQFASIKRVSRCWYRNIYSIQSLVDFQKMWRDIAYSIGHISKRSITNDPYFAKSVKMKKSKGYHLELQGPAEKSKMLIETLRSVPMQLVLISHTEVWPLEQLTVCTLVRAQSFLLEYFSYIGC